MAAQTVNHGKLAAAECSGEVGQRIMQRQRDPKSAAPRVLIVDDDARFREATRHILQEEGFDVVQAEDGSQATAAYRLQPAVVVLCDMFMPGKEGIETIRELRREFPEVRIIAMSGGGASGNVDVLKAAKHLGAAAVLKKPFAKSSLIDAIRTATAGR